MFTTGGNFGIRSGASVSLFLYKDEKIDLQCTHCYLLQELHQYTPSALALMYLQIAPLFRTLSSLKVECVSYPFLYFIPS